MNGIYLSKNINITPEIINNNNIETIMNDLQLFKCNTLNYNKLIGHNLFIYYDNNYIKLNKNINKRASLINKLNIYGDCILLSKTFNFNIHIYEYIINIIKNNIYDKTNIEKLYLLIGETYC
jgi:hypothetical protein